MMSHDFFRAVHSVPCVRADHHAVVREVIWKFSIMNVEDVPQELIEILDHRAGRKHSRTGSVVSALAEILTRWEEIRDDYSLHCPRSE